MRLFFALWPTKAIAAKLHALVPREAGGRPMRTNTLHMTLAFIGNVEPAALDAIRAAVGSVRAAAFSMCIDRLGYWPGNRILWASPSQVPDELIRLADSVRSGLDVAHIPFDHKPFVPHVTLMRHARAAPDEPTIAPIDWRVDDWCLVRSSSDERRPSYEIVERWKMAA